MMKDVFVVADNIVSPVSLSSTGNFQALASGQSGIALHEQPALSPVPVYASLMGADAMQTVADGVGNPSFTKFEQLLAYSIAAAVQQSSIRLSDPSTIMVISSTKGNIALLENEPAPGATTREAIGLGSSAKKLAAHFSLAHTPVIISNACISGITALLTAKRLLETGQYKHAVVTGADVISAFVVSGFQSFQAISQQPCRPFDAARNGINLGEAAATIVLSTQPGERAVQVSGGGVTNDANHISGPSRSGQELCMGINRALKEASLNAGDIGFISAHGTATIYNDEMEAKAFSLAGLSAVPLNSLKGYYGHTLGAAGLVESVIALQTLQQGT
ncbi:MAG TPA: beta-ketoacyl synthase N-terminal-like domain-containing protein, partial [Chitinophagaceae bacterium]|nr:beta-ketoacyl synthase N-terminal-like domain-containing protein [Chitinophagaceae bacterium]